MYRYCRKMTLFSIIMLMILVVSGCKSEPKVSENANETKVSKNEKADEFVVESTEQDTYDEEDFSIPYVDKDCKYIGNSFSVLKKKGDVTSADIVVTSGLPAIINDTEDDKITYFYAGSNTYMGVKDDTVLVYTFHVDGGPLAVNELLEDDAFYTQPLFVVDRNKYVDLYWELSNGYMIISAMPWGEDYFNYAATWVTFTSSLDQCPIAGTLATSAQNSSVANSNLNSDSNWDYNEFETAPFTMEEFWNSQKVNEEWYDNGIFSAYISKVYPTDIWEYSADIYPEMSDNPFGYTGFEIYIHQCEEAQQVYYYLVPISEMPAPVVYAYDDVSNTMKIVFSDCEIIE